MVKNMPTNQLVWNSAMEKWKVLYKKKEEEQMEFDNDKKLLLGFLFGQTDPSIVQQIKVIPQLEQLKQDKDLIGTLKILQNESYTNKDGGLTFETMRNILLVNKCVNYVMKDKKSRLDLRDNIRVNYEA